MLTAGFTFIRNAIRYDYPVVESIRSVLPLCDLFVVAVGHSDDDTLELIRGIGDTKIRIIETVWDDALREGGRVLAVETDKARAAIPPEYDWCFYIQGDEVIHEKDYPAIRSGMEQCLKDPEVEGLLFNYLHFYGSYDYLGASRRWYRREVRIVRNLPDIRSYRDAQGFRRYPNGAEGGGQKLKVRRLNASVYHYGWVKHPEQQLNKQLNFNKLWHSDQKVAQMVPSDRPFDYDGSEPLERFFGEHPAVMQSRIAAVNWSFESDPTRYQLPLKHRLSAWVERITGWRPGEYKNYKTLPGKPVE